MDCKSTWELAQDLYYDGLEEEYYVYFFKHPRLGQPVSCFTVASMGSLKTLHFSLALLGLSWKGEGFGHHQYVKKSLCLYHFVLQPCRAGCQAQICCKASLSRPYSLSPLCPPHQCATIVLMWWEGSTQTTDEGSAGSPGPCAGALRQGLQGYRGAMASHAPCHPPLRHLPPPQNLCSTAKVAFLFLHWNNHSAAKKNRMFFPRTMDGGMCMQLRSYGDPLETDAGRAFPAWKSSKAV